jgi:hypothetical protein
LIRAWSGVGTIAFAFALGVGLIRAWSGVWIRTIAFGLGSRLWRLGSVIHIPAFRSHSRGARIGIGFPGPFRGLVFGSGRLALRVLLGNPDGEGHEIQCSKEEECFHVDEIMTDRRRNPANPPLVSSSDLHSKSYDGTMRLH